MVMESVVSHLQKDHNSEKKSESLMNFMYYILNRLKKRKWTYCSPPKKFKKADIENNTAKNH